MSDSDCSNALVATVQFYSQALARSEEARRQLEAHLRQVLSHPPGREDPELKALVAAALAVVDGGNMGNMYEAAHAYRRSRNEVDRVEPAAAHPGPVRGAPADGSADLPRPDN
jgi:hypothetical protein